MVIFKVVAAPSVLIKNNIYDTFSGKKKERKKKQGIQNNREK